MHDANGTPLKVGDRVLIPAKVRDCQSHAGYCNVTVETEIPRRGDGGAETAGPDTLTLNTGTMIKVPASPATL